MHIITPAFLTVLSLTRRLNILQSLPPRRLLHTLKIITDTVVVFIQPAVEPGLPPMNIRITVRSLLLEVRPAVSIVLKPAVLAVTELKRDEKHDSSPDTH